MRAAEELGYKPAVAEARFWFADIELSLGDLDAGMKDGREAAFDAESTKLESLAARAWGNLLQRASGHPKYGDAHLYERLANLALERLGGDPLVEGTLLGHSAVLAAIEAHDLERSSPPPTAP